MRGLKQQEHTILVADDDEDLSWAFCALLEKNSFKVEKVRDGQGVLDFVSRQHTDLLLLDYVLPDMDGVEVLRRLRERDTTFPIILITAFGSISSAVEAMRIGAYDYLTKPIDNHDLIYTIQRALEKYELERKVMRLESRLHQEADLFSLMGSSEPVKRLNEAIGLVAKTDMTVVLQGETGTGKEIVAREIHRRSLRGRKPFVALDCGAIPDGLLESELFGYEKGAFTGAEAKKEGYFQLARGGTLFLDEVSNLPLALQRKLLRVLQEKKVQPLGSKQSVPVVARIIASTNKDLEEMVHRGEFRRDLYHRLNEFFLPIPPLSERQDDILHLAKLFLEEAAEELDKSAPRLTERAVQFLLEYDYPGNVRELKNIVRRAVILSDGAIEPRHLMPSLPKGSSIVLRLDLEQELKAGPSLKAVMKKVAKTVERRVIEEALNTTKNNKVKAARLLKVDRKTLYNKLQE